MAFLLIGQIMLFSATGVLGLQRHGSEFYFVTRQAICALFGLAVMVAVSQVPYQRLAKLAPWLLALQFVLVAATLFTGYGHHAQGATRWLRLGPLAFQPSELAKLTVAIYVASLVARHKEAPLKPGQWALRMLPVVALLALILKQPDLGTTVLLASSMLGILFIAGMRWQHLVALLGSGLGLTAFFILGSEYRRRRLMAFLDPWADPQGNGFQTIQSFLSFHSGKVFGVGLGNGNSKLFFLPEVHTDFIFALIGEELGFVGALAIIALFLYFAYLLLKTAQRAPDRFGCYLAVALTLSLTLQVIVNLGGVTGVIPVKGLPLPFISWGRSALVVNLMLVGILLNVARQSSIIRDNSTTRR